MKLSIALILYEFRKSSNPPKISYQELLSAHSSITKVRLFCDEAYKDDVLYVAAAGSFKSNADLPKLIFVAGCCDSDLKNNVVYCDLSLVDLFNAIDSIFERYARIETELNKAVAGNAPLRTILNICTEFFGNPVTLCDTHLRFIETCDIALTDELPEYLQKALETGFVDNEIVNLLKKKNLDLKLYHNKDVILVRLDEVPTAFFSSNIYNSGKLAATLTVHELYTGLDSAQSVIVEQISKVIEDYTFKNYRGRSGTLLRIENVVFDILSGKTVSDDIIDNHLKAMNWNSDDGFYLMVIQANKDSFENGRAKYSYGTFQKYFPGSFVLELENTAIILINSSRMKYDLNTALDQAKKHIEKMLDKVMLSRYFQSFRLLNEHYRASTDAFKIAQIIDCDKYLYSYTDYIFPLMLKLCGTEYDVRTFCIKEALDLHEYDKVHGREFFKSLYLYLKHNKSLTAASDELRVHPNTLIYRIGRVTDLLKINMDDTDKCLALVRSYEILHYRKQVIDDNLKI